MNTRQKDTTASVIGGVIGAVVGTALAIAIQVQLEIGFGLFYLVGLIAGAGAGAQLGGRLMLRSMGTAKIAPGVYVTAPGWQRASMGDAIKLTKGDASLVITTVQGNPNDSEAAILEKYASDNELELNQDTARVALTGEAVGLDAGGRRSFTATIDGQRFEGDVTAFVLDGNGLVFHASAPAGVFAGVADEVHRSVASLERIAPTFG